jgi:hypothetical protein
MEAQYNELRHGWQIVYAKRYWAPREIWGKPVNNRVYESQAEAWSVLDKWMS